MDRQRLATLLERERAEFVARNPRSHTAYKSSEHLFGRVPMTWMNKTAGRVPGLPRARRAAPGSPTSTGTSTSTCAWATPARWPGTPRRRSSPRSAGGSAELGGASAMLPTEDAALGRRRADPPVRPAGVELRADRHRRQPLGDPAGCGRVTGRPRILVNSYCYHGSVDESLIVRRPGRAAAQPRRATSARPATCTLTSRVAEYQRPGRAGARAGARRRRRGADGAGADQHRHRAARARLPGRGAGADPAARHAADQRRDPHVLGRPGRRAPRRGASSPDVVTIGKAIGGGIPVGAYGLSAELAARCWPRTDLDLIDMGGVGGTLAGNAGVDGGRPGRRLERGAHRRRVHRHDRAGDPARRGRRSGSSTSTGCPGR